MAGRDLRMASGRRSVSLMSRSDETADVRAFPRTSLGWSAMSTTSLPIDLSARLRVDTRHPSPGRVRVILAGEIDLASRSELQARLLGVLSAPAPHQMEVDLGGVTFMSCTGLTVLIIVGKVAAGSGCRMSITNPQPMVRRVLDLTGLSLVFMPISPDQALTTSMATSTGSMPLPRLGS